MEKGRSFSALDGIRGIAALAIVSRHAFTDRTLLLPRSYLAVDLFLCLSGWVLFHVYDSRFAGGLTTRRFLAERIIRIFPLYILGTLLGFLLAIGQESRWKLLGTLAFNAIFLPVPATDVLYSPTLFPFNYPSWSLFWELLINGVFALAIPWLRSLRYLAAIVALGVVLLLATTIVYGGLDAGAEHATFPGGAGRAAYSFFAGILLYRLYRSDRITIALPFWASVMLIVIIFAVPVSGGIASGLFDFVAAALLLPLLVVTAARAEQGRTMTRVCSVLGVSSYAIYALHVPMIGALQRVMTGVGVSYHDLSNWALVPICAVAFVVALAADKFFDIPVRRRLRSYLNESSVG